MNRCTDEYGNLDNRLKVGAVVESDLAVFTVGEIYNNKLVKMDENKPYKIKNPSNPMSNCLNSGNYAVMATSLKFSETI